MHHPLFVSASVQQKNIKAPERMDVIALSSIQRRRSSQPVNCQFRNGNSNLELTLPSVSRTNFCIFFIAPPNLLSVRSTRWPKSSSILIPEMILNVSTASARSRQQLNTRSVIQGQAQDERRRLCLALSLSLSLVLSSAYRHARPE